MKLTTAAQWTEAAARHIGPLNRADNKDSARIFLQGRANELMFEYQHGRATIEEVNEVKKAAEEVAK